ncbi:hypothetical protein CLV24_111158 [Pontibacter ummariensis]|uniref:Uncharacterized protein n=1 Tax=Pontibacter ummariensis TaxID=1610492 RepID=A0A239GNF0_9BACT|nr:hypothetical protein [Pontibacter ummariensis]PRY11363.1 hypothetical protein CLV24_111158 [Pontibacter ummariensis]SNS70796.1 hypothetical protein SAMN06296052_111158 [Pontibacter ummariensis]
MVKTGIPANTYSLILKVVVLFLLLGYVIENTLLAVGLGILSGLILHVWVSYYDCVVHLENGVAKFYFLRPFFFKEVHDLKRLDKVEIIREDKYKTQREIWWQADMLYQVSYDRMILYKGKTVHEIKFRTNENDLPKLEVAVKEMFEGRAGITLGHHA